MFLIDGALRWSASDLTAATTCEYGLLRTLDYKLRWAEPITTVEDPLQEHIARLGDRHEERLLAAYRAAGDVAELAHVPPPYSLPVLQAAAEATAKAFASEPEVVYQAAFFDGQFFGYADFIERDDDGWVVCDAKLARHAKPSALLQLGAYADQLAHLDLPVSATVSLLLGNGERADFALSDVLPVFHERRARLRSLLAEHQAAGTPVVWGSGGVLACGRCAECEHAAQSSNDLILVAGLRMDQRAQLRSGGVESVAQLAAASQAPTGMPAATFEKLRSQAALQWKQQQEGEGAPVEYELTATAATMLALLPAPSPGDFFFDFEGDPLYDDGDPSRTGLEYLWGVLTTDEAYQPIWAHSAIEERAALIEFLDRVAEQRAKHPDMHIYHYAPYETSALKRLAMRYQTREKELDDLLRSEVFVDLYATVRGSLRVGQPSYSIKKLEPLYMGDELRESDVADGAASVVAYQQYRDLRTEDPAAAEQRLNALADYNEYDCLSTLRLRDWLLQRADDVGVRDLIVPRALDVEGTELSTADPVFVELMERSGPELPADRTAEQQAYAMLATAIDFYRREHKQFWWEHYDRLNHSVQDWSATRDVFVVESAEVVADWAVPGGKARNLRRTLRLVGDWAPGSKDGDCFQVVYAAPGPIGSNGPEGGPQVVCGNSDALVRDPHDARIVTLTESRKPENVSADVPVALVPTGPPSAGALESAIMELATTAVESPTLAESAVVDLLLRRPPRMLGGGGLPEESSPIEGAVAALLGMANSYVAIQGPPGTGKTYTATRVLKELVEEHHWRIGVVAQSHAVVENVLSCLTACGLDAGLVGKTKTESDSPTWTALKPGKAPTFLAEHVDTGCILGGTAWDFANANTVERGSLDLLVVEEAGQFSLATTMAASVAARRLLLLGDPQQLPQVSQGTHAEPVDESALGWLMDGAATIPADRGIFLAESYRMHPALCEKVSVLSYAGRLHAAPAASLRFLAGVEPGLEVVAVEHTGNRTESPEEAAAVVDQIRVHLGALWTDPEDKSSPRPLGQNDFLVVAPYNAQVSLIRRTLEKDGLGDVRVGTVDKFQGQEAPIALVSMTASSHGDVPRGMGFLLSRNRVNVAVSRAQWKAIVIRSAGLTAYMPGSAAGLLELGAFIGLCSESTANGQ